VDSRDSIFGRDPDERVVRWGWVLWFAWLAVGGALLLGDYRGGVLGMGAVLAAPFWSLWALWAIYRGVRILLRWLRQSGARAWSGSYYEFDGRQIRIRFDGDDIWFAARDVFDVLNTPRSARDPERVRQIVGRDGLFAPDGGLMSFSEKGLAAWLDRRTDRTAAQFTRWIEAQVVRPYRRRRELGTTEEDASTDRVRNGTQATDRGDAR
jgi:hypothetical protein